MNAPVPVFQGPQLRDSAHKLPPAEHQIKLDTRAKASGIGRPLQGRQPHPTDRARALSTMGLVLT
jgi:hypothetical protein